MTLENLLWPFYEHTLFAWVFVAMGLIVPLFAFGRKSDRDPRGFSYAAPLVSIVCAKSWWIEASDWVTFFVILVTVLVALYAIWLPDDKDTPWHFAAFGVAVLGKPALGFISDLLSNLSISGAVILILMIGLMVLVIKWLLSKRAALKAKVAKAKERVKQRRREKSNST